MLCLFRHDPAFLLRHLHDVFESYTGHLGLMNGLGSLMRMSSQLKRKLSSVTRSVSPPRVRRRTSPPEHPAAPIPSKNISTFFSWNVNGINPLLQKKLDFSRTNATYPLRTFLHDHDWPCILALQEVKISSVDTKTQRLLEAAANSGNKPDEPTYTTHFSLPRDKHNATGFGGKVHGVATLIRDDAPLVTTSKPDWDLEGRVLIHDFQHLNLVVVNGYWVNGTSNPYRDTITGEVTGTRHDHKLRFHAHMLRLCKDFELQGKSVLLLGDMNIAPARIDGYPNLRTSPVQHVLNRADFNDKFLGKHDHEHFGGVDIFRHFHGPSPKFTYHARGRPWRESCDRVDLIVASPELTERGAVVASDICESQRERGHSDHVPLWVQLDISKIRGATTEEKAH